MLPRSNVLYGIGVFLGIAVFSVFVQVPYVAADNAFISFYQEHISPIDGQRCAMHPSCSAYSAGAVEKHGVILGWIMACDRLVRCGRDEAALSAKQILNGQQLVHDPVAANDFWWFEKEETN